MEYQNNEYQLFTHPAQRVGKEGQLLVTNFRLVFLGEENTVQLSLGWGNVSNVQYSPSNDPQGRAALRITTTLKSEKPIAIQLSGGEKEERFIALESLKIIISIARKQGLVRNETKEEVIDYNKLGPTNRLIYDLVAVDEGKGKTSIDLTPELKKIIFDRFPAVKAAFLNEVIESKRITEHKFWEIFFQSEYFNHNKKEDLSHDGRKLFAKYETRKETTNESSISQPATTNLIVDESLLKFQQKTKAPADITAEIDLTSTVGDLINKRWLNEESAKVVTDDKINHLVNADSKMVLPNITSHGNCKESRGLDDELNFAYGKPLQVHAIQLNPSSFTEASAESINPDLEEDSSSFGKRKIQSAFGKSTSTTVHTNSSEESEAINSPIISKGFPEAKVAKKIWDSDVSTVRTFIRDKQLNYFSSESNNQALLDEDGKQELQEIFTTITELLRMFYESVSSQDCNEYSLKRSANIIDRLKDIEIGLSHQLPTKTNNGSKFNNLADEYKESLIQGLLIMIKRAKENSQRLQTLSSAPAIANVSMSLQAKEKDPNRFSLSMPKMKK